MANDTVAENFKIALAQTMAEIDQRIRFAAEKSGRDSREVRLMAVSKTKPVEQILPVYNWGQRLFGENRVKEAQEKFAQLPDDAEVHLIGHLQSNKAKTAAETFSWVQSIDKVKTAAALDKECRKLGKVMNLLLEINTSGEDSKNGFRSEDEYFRALDQILKLENVRVRGLMTMAPFTDDEKIVRSSFNSLKTLFENTKSRYSGLDLDTLSMGMSGDFEWAIQEGSTLVRLGTIIFGNRNYPI